MKRERCTAKTFKGKNCRKRVAGVTKFCSFHLDRQMKSFNQGILLKDGLVLGLVKDVHIKLLSAEESVV